VNDTSAQPTIVSFLRSGQHF